MSLLTPHARARRHREAPLFSASLRGEGAAEDGETVGAKGETTQVDVAARKGKKEKTVFIQPLIMPAEEPVRRYGKPWTGEKLPGTRPTMPAEKRVEVAVVQAKLYEKRKWRLIGDNAFLGLLGTSGAWCVSVKTALSYGLGAALGTMYLVLLARYVQNLGKEGGGGGSARLALAVILVLLATKNKETLELIPSVMGFLTYQVAALVQAVYTDFDRLEDAQEAT